MSEWSIEHAWKTTPATLTEWYPNTPSRNRFNDFPPKNASQCEPVNVGVYRWFRGDLTQFLHSSEFHLCAYSVKRVGTCREDDRRGRSVSVYPRNTGVDPCSLRRSPEASSRFFSSRI